MAAPEADTGSSRASPTIISEAAFQVALASGVVKASRKLASGDWESSVFRATRVGPAVDLGNPLRRSPE